MSMDSLHQSLPEANNASLQTDCVIQDAQAPDHAAPESGTAEPKETEPSGEVSAPEEKPAPADDQTPADQAPADNPAAADNDPQEADKAEQTKAEPVVVQPPAPKTRADIDLEYVTKAADINEYEQLKHEAFPLPDGTPVDVYSACRIGVGHLLKKMPCQDSCTFRKINHGVVLLDADGVSACDQSKYASQTACEIAAEHVEKLSLQHQEEADFVRELCSDAFYIGIREDWVASMEKHWLTLPDRDPDENPFIHYGTTLLIAVVTENWYVTLNLGDGQILLFSDTECMRAQLVDKASQAPSCLVYDTYLEDVRRGVWPRRQYKGILLMTDGMHDQLSKLPWYTCHEYAKQTAARFTEHQAPHQPFIYSAVIKGEQRTYDVSRQRNASDDCSLVMALNSDYMPAEGAAVNDEIKAHFPKATLIQHHRRVGRKTGYLVVSDKKMKLVIVVPEDTKVTKRDARLTHFYDGRVRIWDSEEIWVKDGMRYSVYAVSEDAPSAFLEEDVQGFAFKTVDQYRKVPNQYDSATGRQLRLVEPVIGEPILQLRQMLLDLQAHLQAQAMKFNEMAMYWILHRPESRDSLWLPAEVIAEADDSDVPLPWTYNVDQLSPAMIGYLSCDGQKMPIFGHREPRSVETYYLFGAAKKNEAQSRFFTLVYNKNLALYGLLNISKYTWSLKKLDGTILEVAPGKTVTFAEGSSLTVAPEGRSPFTCVMHVF